MKTDTQISKKKPEKADVFHVCTRKPHDLSIAAGCCASLLSKTPLWSIGVNNTVAKRAHS